MASGTLSATPPQLAVGQELTLTVSISGFSSNTITLSSDNDPGGGTDWQSCTPDGSGSAKVKLTPATAGSYVFTVNIDGAAGGTANVTVTGPATTTTVAPSAATTSAPAAATTAAPAATTAAPATTAAAATTASPTPTTTGGPAASTTAAAGASTTAAPGASTTAAPGASTTAAAGSTTTAAPGSTTTGAPGSTTTGAGSGPGGATGAGGGSGAGSGAGSGGGSGDTPTVDASFTIDASGDVSQQNPKSIQVPKSAKLTLNWAATNADTVNIGSIGSGDGLPASGSRPVPTQDGNYSVVAVGKGGQSVPFNLEVHTHDDGQVVSPHIDLGTGVVAVISFSANKDNQAITNASKGDSITLTVVVSDATQSVKINGQDADLTDLGNGQKQATVNITVDASCDGNFSAYASGSGDATGTQHIDINGAGTGSGAGSGSGDHTGSGTGSGHGSGSGDHTGGGSGSGDHTGGGSGSGSGGGSGSGDHTGGGSGSGDHTGGGSGSGSGGGSGSGSGDWTAAWDGSTAGEATGVQMNLTAKGLAAGTDIQFVVLQDGYGTLGTVSAKSEDGKASAIWTTWLKIEAVGTPQTIDADKGEKFKVVTFSFTVSAGGKSATSKPITYSDKVTWHLIDGSGAPAPKTTITVCLPYGTLTATSDGSGDVTLDGLPPGPAHVAIE